MPRSTPSPVALAALLALVATPAAAQTYSATPVLFDAYGLNSTGQVVGLSNPFSPTPYLLTGPNGSAPGTALPEFFTPGSTSTGGETKPVSLASDGTVLGINSVLVNNALVPVPSVWRPGLAAPVALLNLTGGTISATGVNGSGRVVGFGGPSNEALYWNRTQPGGPGTIGSSIAFTLQRFASGAVSARANAINDAGRIVGAEQFGNGTSQALYWDPFFGTYDIGQAVPGTGTMLSSVATAVSSTGGIAGAGTCAGNVRCMFFWNGQTGLGSNTFFASAVAGSFLEGVQAIKVNGVNSGGIVVGTMTFPNFDVGFHWNTTNGTVGRLGDLVDTPRILNDALGINDAGQIIANGPNGFFNTGFLLNTTAPAPPVTAVPEPSTYALLASGLVALGLARRRAGRPRA